MDDVEFKEILHGGWRSMTGRNFHVVHMQMKSLAWDFMAWGQQKFVSIKLKIKKLKEKIRRYKRKVGMD